MARKRFSVDEAVSMFMDDDIASLSDSSSSVASLLSSNEGDGDSNDDLFELDIPAPSNSARGRGTSRGKGRVRTRGGVRPRTTNQAGAGSSTTADSKAKQPKTRHDYHWEKKHQIIPEYAFCEQPGLQVQLPANVTPMSCFEILCSDEYWEWLCKEINAYARREIDVTEQRRSSRFNDWIPITVPELKKFFGLLLHMGPMNFPTIKDYWSTDLLYQNTLFKSVMSRNRFQLILRFLHFSSDTTGGRLTKIKPLIDYFNDKMRATYIPERDLSLDESMVLWRGRLCFRQYIKNKRHKYGVKFFELCESKGLVLRFAIYTGEPFNDPLNLGQSSAVVLHLMDDYLDKGHKLYMDNYYNSVPLMKVLGGRKTYACGTLRFDRSGNPVDVVKAKLKKGESEWSTCGEVVVCKWKDKREVLTISNMHRFEMIPVRNRHGQEAIKPNLVADYNMGMSGVDRSDQNMSYYSALRKTIRWYKKIGLHIMEMMLHNARHFYNLSVSADRTMKNLEFREVITKSLIGPITIDVRQQPQATFHYLEILPPTEKKNKPTRNCTYCWANKRRRESRYFCAKCPSNPSLCIVDCFRLYHQTVEE